MRERFVEEPIVRDVSGAARSLKFYAEETEDADLRGSGLIRSPDNANPVI